MQKKIITRFAPSPTGFLHIGGARTALFNWLYAKCYNGEFLLRVEDTDEKRSTQAAIDAIINALSWLGLQHDKEIIFQSKNRDRHVEIAQELVNKGQAYYCYAENSEITQKTNLGFRSKWRNNSNQIPSDIKPVVRLKVPDNGSTTISDKVYGEMVVANSTLEDFVILRSDGTPTYMLSVVVDDHDMGITHVIRGADHITNTAKQILIYNAIEWDKPIFAHIPLIHGSDGAKMSKRHGALGVEEYQKMGFLPAAVRNYLLRLGWSNRDEEIIDDYQAIALFDFKNIGKSPANFDLQKLQHINNHYLRNTADIIEQLKPFIGTISQEKEAILSQAIDVLTEKAKTLVELAKLSEIFTIDEIIMEKDAYSALNREILLELKISLNALQKWDRSQAMLVINHISQKYTKKAIYQTLRAALTGTMNSPAIILVMLALGQKITLDRLNNV